ncbi:hypothetical protein AGOR_G00226020 [Albula goreensis]|uniref:Neurotransmitter-gated ion-channel ligand-binding domain-containing protein n=1 Tax=Albula goreensis TaxID=1534307 RepID=A0A8T3CKQ9_9TELE|nr:hypothetical protein AGOR_G00226020 [Albula goreensis]
MAAGHLRSLSLFLTLIHLIVPAETNSSCVTRRCLAQMLINKEIISQPQTDNCTVDVFLKYIIYQTVDVDTKKLLFTSTLKILMVWNDPALAWNTSVYPYDQVMLPVKKVWTPNLFVKNAVNVLSEPTSSDVMVLSDGDVTHQVLMHITVGCDINLYTYPYSSDFCPIYLDGKNPMGCGSVIEIGETWPKGRERGDWRTNSVESSQDENGYNYFWVNLETRSFNPTVTLVIPSILIMLADMASFALPLGGGERISFKVTLVLSFIIFCSPLIRYHFCVCLFALVISMVQSMLLTRLSADGSLLPFSLRKWCKRSKEAPEPEGDAHTGDNESEVPQTTTSPNSEDSTLHRMVKHLDDRTKEDQLILDRKCFAKKLDKICFWIYVGIFIIYCAAIMYMFAFYECEVDHLEF